MAVKRRQSLGIRRPDARKQMIKHIFYYGQKENRELKLYESSIREKYRTLLSTLDKKVIALWSAKKAM